MITNFFKNKIIILLLIITILFIYTLIPKNTNDQITYQSVFNDYVYLLDQDNYLVRTEAIFSSNDQAALLKEKIAYLIIDSPQNILIDNAYKPLIPKNTKVLDLRIDDATIKVDFSKELLNISPALEEKMIEAIIYTLTEDDSIKEVMIFVEGTLITNLPNSHITLPKKLNREYGINKVSNLTDYKNIAKTTVYFIKDDHYLPVTLINNDNHEKVEIIINELKSNNINDPDLVSYLKASTILENYEILSNSINLSFNKYIFDDFKNKLISEEVKYAIYFSLKDNYQIKEVNYLYDNQVVSQINT
ncbi:MAG: GerMN domain-containing protein [Bacilli bacterium]|nr:GerMN domain-containing protein [Bacilli bacterium]